MSVFIPIPVQELHFETEQPSKTYKLDLERGRILPLGTADGLEAARQFVRKALITPRFRCLIYDNQYGSELKQTVIAGDATPEFVETEIPRLVREALLADSRIFDVYGIDVSFKKDPSAGASTASFEGDNVFISLTAHTAFGRVDVREVI